MLPKSIYTQSFIWRSHPTTYISHSLLLGLFANTNTGFPKQDTSSDGTTATVSPRSWSPWEKDALRTSHSCLLSPGFAKQVGRTLILFPVQLGLLLRQAPKFLPTAQHRPDSFPLSSCIQLQACLLNLCFAVAANTGLGQPSWTSQGNPVTEEYLLKICVWCLLGNFEVIFFIIFYLPGWWDIVRIKMLQDIFNYCSNASLQSTSKHQ